MKLNEIDLKFAMFRNIHSGLATGVGSTFPHQRHVLELQGGIFLEGQECCYVRSGELCQEHGADSLQGGPLCA